MTKGDINYLLEYGYVVDDDRKPSTKKKTIDIDQDIYQPIYK